MIRISTAFAAAGLALTLGASTAAGAAEITLLCSNALKTVVEELVAPFEKATGHQLKVTYGSTGGLQAQIEKGDAVDVAILGAAAVDDLVKKGKLVAATRIDMARSGMGVAIRRGAPRPEIGTTEAFKRALLNAKSIAYSEGGLSGTYLKSLIERLGLADALKSKIKYGSGAEMVSTGAAEIGITQISEILPAAGVELAGPLPPEVQNYTVFPAAAAAASRQAEAAGALLKFLGSPDAARVMKAKGLEPAA
jgi:molybdate transport system substrate-binding protein